MNTPALANFSNILIPGQPGSLRQVSTLAQEQSAYQVWGWSFTTQQIPDGPPNTPSFYAAKLSSGQDIHGDFEADDLWQNLTMYKRTGNIVYRQMAELWAAYYINTYEYDTQNGGNPDKSFYYDHLFGFGLIDWFEETWDVRALAAAVRLGQLSLGSYRHSNQLRASARHLLLATRLWEKTGEQRWRSHMQAIRDDLFNPVKWPVAAGQPNSYDPVLGIWMIDRAEPEHHVVADTLHLGWINWALATYYEATGVSDTVVKDQLVKMARFAQTYGLGPDGQSGSYIAFDTGSPVYATSLHMYTTYWIDTLLRGHRITGDNSLADRAKLHWQNGTDAPTGQIGRFVNKEWLADTPFYSGNGELTYCQLLFIDAVNSPLPPPVIILADNTWQQVVLAASSRYTAAAPTYTVSPNPVATSDPMVRFYAGVLAGNEQLYYFGGGHSGYPGNDVEVLDTTTMTWEQSYKPEVCPYGIPSSCSGIYSGAGTTAVTPLGRPYTEHTFQIYAHDPRQNRLFAVLTSGTWAYDPSTKAWTPLAGPHAGNTFSPGGAAGGAVGTWHLLNFDLGINAFQAIATSGPISGIGTFRFNDLTNLWEKRGNLPDNNWAQLYSTYAPGRGVHFVYSIYWSHPWWKYDAMQEIWTVLPAPPATPDSFDYDTQNGVVIAVHYTTTNKPRIMIFNPDTNIWTETVPSIGPTVPEGGTGRMCHGRYITPKNIFILVVPANEVSTNTWMYRYKN